MSVELTPEQKRAALEELALMINTGMLTELDDLEPRLTAIGATEAELEEILD